ncbi:MAG: PQQ-dependent sugar dehydrogenase, partial [Planctomycetota bacterium]
YAPGDSSRLYIIQRSGAIRILNLDTGNLNGSTFMTVPSVDTFFEGGLLGLAFHPDFQNNGYFYVNYTISAGGSFRTRIARFTATNADSANSATQQVVLEINQPQGNHNAGWIGFSPTDNYLYVTSGDGGNFDDTGTGHTNGIGNSQDITNNLLGKMLRLDVDGDDFPTDSLKNYAIPPTNPFVGLTGDDEIFIYGLRNPFRCSFDRSNGDLYIGDVGQNAREEIDVFPNGYTGKYNMGWRLREGAIQTPSSGIGGAQPADGINPIYDYIRTGNFGGRSVTGGVVYRGPIEGLQGNYLFADYVSNNFWSLAFDGSDVDSFNGNNFEDLIRWNGIFDVDAGFVAQIVGFGEDLDGNVYIVDLGGEVFKIVDGSTTNPPVDGAVELVFSFPGVQESGTNADLNASDDTYLKYRNVAAASGDTALQMNIWGNVPFTDASALRFNFESNVTTPNLTQTIEIFNFLTDQYEEFDSRNASVTDELVNVEIDDPAVYINAFGDVRARITYSSNGPVVSSPWAALMDLAQFQVIE